MTSSGAEAAPPSGPHEAGDVAFLAVDWGSSSLRVARVANDGATVDTRVSAAGLRTVEDRQFEAALAETAGDWLEPKLPVILSGMVTSRQGWVETPYVTCPAGLPDLAAQLVERRMETGQYLHFVPGVMQQTPFFDVIRGEEVQIVGAMASDSGMVVLPGTHSKWVAVDGGRIARFATFLTGELYDVVRRNTLVGAAMEGDADDPEWFGRGVEDGLADPRLTGGPLRQIFGIRPLGLIGGAPKESLAAYLSGLLVGAEIAGARNCMGSTDSVVLIGSSPLVRRYSSALAIAGISTRDGPEDAAARGAFAIARLAGLI